MRVMQETKQEVRETTTVRVYSDALLKITIIRGLLAERGLTPGQPDIVDEALDAYRRELAGGER